MRSNPANLAAAVLAVLVALTVPPAALGLTETRADAIPPHPFNVTDLTGLFRVSELVTSPNGAWGVYATYMWDGNATKNLLLMNMESGLASFLTFKKKVSDFNACFNPSNDFVFFLSTRSGSVQVHAIPVSGSDADVIQITDLPLDLANLRWSPAGNYLSFSASVYLDCPADKMMECTAARDQATAARGSNTGHLYNSLYVRHWNAYETEGKHSVLFVLPISYGDNGFQPIYPALPISYGLSAAAPVPPFGGIEQYAWSADGKEIAFTAELIKRDTAWTTGWRIFTVAIGDKGPVTGSLKNIVDKVTQARTQNPTYSPDGKLLAYLAMDRPGYEADRLHINIYDRKSGTTTPLTSKWDRSVDGILWSTDSTYLVAGASDQGRHKLWTVSVPGGRVEELVSTGHNINPSWSQWGGLFYLKDSLTAPADVWMVDVKSKQERQISWTNYYVTLTTIISTPKEIIYKGADGDTIQSWFLPPVNWKEGQKYPLVVLIHGGPQGAWEDAWSYRWNPQNWAGHGYAVWAPNPHGSTGWGQNFTDAIIGDWGGKPYVDIMMGLKTVLTQFSWLDPDRVAALGASYGGYMINWINGNAPKGTFKCLVCHDGIFNTVAFYYSTEELFFPEYMFEGTPMTNPNMYNKWNPAAFTPRWTTPTMVIHGGEDYRVPLSEGLGAFTALQRQNISSQFLFFPEEDHWVLKPENSIMWYESVLAWLDGYLRP